MESRTTDTEFAMHPVPKSNESDGVTFTNGQIADQISVNVSALHMKRWEICDLE